MILESELSGSGRPRKGRQVRLGARKSWRDKASWSLKNKDRQAGDKKAAKTYGCRKANDTHYLPMPQFYQKKA